VSLLLAPSESLVCSLFSTHPTRSSASFQDAEKINWVFINSVLSLRSASNYRCWFPVIFNVRFTFFKSQASRRRDPALIKESHAYLNATNRLGLDESNFQSRCRAEEKLPISAKNDKEFICVRVALLSRPSLFKLRVFYADTYRRTVGHVMAQAVSRRLLGVEAIVQSQASSCRIYKGPSGSVRLSSEYFSFLLSMREERGMYRILVGKWGKETTGETQM
jgi:hypothetical protein